MLTLDPDDVTLCDLKLGVSFDIAFLFYFPLLDVHVVYSYLPGPVWEVMTEACFTLSK